MKPPAKKPKGYVEWISHQGVKMRAYNKTSKYKYVRRGLYLISGEVFWLAKVTGFKDRSNHLWSIHSTERDAAIAVDKHFLKRGMEPRNILKKRTKL